jgi:hypothetical protein
MATKVLYAVPMAHETTLTTLERLRAEGVRADLRRSVGAGRAVWLRIRAGPQAQTGPSRGA